MPVHLLVVILLNPPRTQQQEKQQQPLKDAQSDSDTESIGDKPTGTLERQPSSGQALQQPQPQQQQQMQQAQPQQPQQPQFVMQDGAVRQSRIKDRPQPKETRDSSLKIKVELDLEAEVDLYARVKGDVTIGLM